MKLEHCVCMHLEIWQNSTLNWLNQFYLKAKVCLQNIQNIIANLLFTRIVHCVRFDTDFKLAARTWQNSGNFAGLYCHMRCVYIFIVAVLRFALYTNTWLNDRHDPSWKPVNVDKNISIGLFTENYFWGYL